MQHRSKDPGRNKRSHAADQQRQDRFESCAQTFHVFFEVILIPACSALKHRIKTAGLFAGSDQLKGYWFKKIDLSSRFAQ